MQSQYPTTADQLPDYLREWAKSGALTAGSSLPGVAPEDGWMHQGANAPTLPEGAKGYWAMTSSGVGPASNYGENSGMDQRDNATWRFVGEKEEKPYVPQGAPDEPQAPRPVADPNGKTIYNDWDFYKNQARAEVEAGLNSPFVQNPQELIGLDRKQQMQAFYPSAWQEDGVQKVIGPNGKNIAPDLLADGTLALFREGDANTSTARDWPSLVEMLQKTNRVTPDQFQTLLRLGENKKPDQSFAGPGGMGGQALLGSFR
jgi:hypothetical protein